MRREQDYAENGETMIARLRAYFLGVREFRSDYTTHFDYPLIETYDAGRDMAHRLTFRKWDW